MSGCAYFKFKSALEYDSVTFDGVFISVAELKRSIREKKGLTDGDLLLINAHTNEGALGKHSAIVHVVASRATDSCNQEIIELGFVYDKICQNCVKSMIYVITGDVRLTPHVRLDKP